MEEKGFIASLTNGFKILTSKRAYALGGTIIAVSLIKNPVAIVTLGVVAIAYIVAESRRPS